MATPFKVKAVFEYNSPHDDDLSFPLGQIITVTEQEDNDWYVGQYTDSAGTSQEGLFPKNFVEKYEPEAPPRPTRARPRKEPSGPSLADDPAPVTSGIPPPPKSAAGVPDTETQNGDTSATAAQSGLSETSVPHQVLKPATIVSSTSDPVQLEATTHKMTAKAPPPVAEKPSSFKDRIAAFNKTSAQPIAPIKPGPQTGGAPGFIKKPFVAPPPARDSYVPPLREATAQKIYRREEDPEIVQQQAQDLENAEKAGLVANQADGDAEGDEVATKPTSLKDRIAALQKQQQEQSVRRSEVTQKEKPQKPAKQRPESANVEPSKVQDDTSELTREVSRGSTKRQSVEGQRVVRQLSSDARSPAVSTKELVNDPNDADVSGAGDTEADVTSIEDTNERSGQVHAPRLSAKHAVTGYAASQFAQGESKENVQDDGQEEEEHDDMDSEARRKLALRERMAKMSGGMGMPGMFMPVGGIAVAGVTQSKRRQTSGSSHAAEVDMPSSPTHHRTPDMQPAPEFEQIARPPTVRTGSEGSLPIISGRHAEEVADVEDLLVQPPEHQRPPQTVHQQPTNSQSQSRSQLQPQEQPIPDQHLTAQRPPPPSAPSGRLVPAPPAPVRSGPPPLRSPSQPTEDEMVSNPSTGSESDDEMPATTILQAPTASQQRDLPIRPAPPPIPGMASQPESSRLPPISTTARMPYLPPVPPPPVPSFPTFVSPPEQRYSRNLSTIPVGIQTMSPVGESRLPPPPPPPTAVPRHATVAEVKFNITAATVNDGESDYEGDYDTDIASGTPHKEALKAHTRDGSVANTDETLPTPPRQVAPVLAGQSPLSPTAMPRTTPQALSSPQQQLSQLPQPPSRSLVEAPRGPPPIPRGPGDPEDYDPYRYPQTPRSMPPAAAPPIPGAQQIRINPADSPTQSSQRLSRPLQDSPQSPLMAARDDVALDYPVGGQSMTSPPREVNRRSIDAVQSSDPLPAAARRSLDQNRSTGSFIAQNVDLEKGNWWTHNNMPPPAYQNRPDVLYEMEESSSSKRGGRAFVTKDVYVLFHDYSQTVITARFDAADLTNVTLEQRHEAPPIKPRQDQLEQAHRRFGAALCSAAMTKQNMTVGNGNADALVLDLLRTIPGVLMPVGTRAYGALVYANFANATSVQHDEIRTGDVVTFRNAKFQGKHGTMHSKYAMDVGKPEHVGIVVDWDGTKRKVRALEQGRESRKVKMESFRLGDLRSGEVKIWRVMGRAWVGWEGN